MVVRSSPFLLSPHLVTPLKTHRLGPQKLGVDQLDTLEGHSELLQTDREELAALEGAVHPRRLATETKAATAPEDNLLALDALRDVNLGTEAVDAHVGGIRLDRYAALAAEDHRDRVRADRRRRTHQHWLCSMTIVVWANEMKSRFSLAGKIRERRNGWTDGG